MGLKFSHLDVVTQHLVVALGATLAETLATHATPMCPDSLAREQRAVHDKDKDSVTSGQNILPLSQLPTSTAKLTEGFFFVLVTEEIRPRDATPRKTGGPCFTSPTYPSAQTDRERRCPCGKELDEGGDHVQCCAKHARGLATWAQRGAGGVEAGWGGGGFHSARGRGTWSTA